MRAATSVVFAADGAAYGLWVAHLPIIRARFDLDPSMLAIVLVVVSAGAILGTFVGARVMARFGDVAVLRIAIVLASMLAACALWARSLESLVASAFAFAVALGIAEVAMNSVGSRVQREAGRAWMSSFHGCWSLGFFAAASLTSLLLATHGPDTLLPCSVVVVVACVGAIASRDRTTVGSRDRATADALPTAVDRDVALLAAVVFFGWLGEGALTDWAPVYMSVVAHQTAAVAAAVSTAYGLAMTCSRFAGDAFAERYGARNVLVVSTLAAALVVALAASLHSPIVAAIAFALGGAAIANLSPLIFGLAGRYGPRAIGTITSIGYVAFLSGPALLGFAAHLVGLRAAFALPIVALSVSTLVATRYRERPT